MLYFKNTDDASLWLRGKPREVAIVIAARSTLRAIPALATVLARGGLRAARPDIILPTFRGMAAPWATAAYPAHSAALRAASSAAAAAAAAAAAVVAFSALPEYGTYASAPSSAAAAAGDAVAASAPAEYFSPAAAAAGDAVVAAATADDAVVAAAAGDAVEIDAGLRAGGHASAVAAALAFRPLWPNKEPEWASKNWKKVKSALLASGENDWGVWTDWYEARLRGGPANEALEVARVMIPDEIWDRGPAVVNARIKKLIAEHSPETPVSEEKKEEPKETQPSIEAVPSQGPGPRYRANEEGRIDRAPVVDIDERGNDIKTIDQLRPLVLRCAAELQTRLSLNQFPELIASVQSYRAALEPGGNRPIEWGEVWGLGVLLQNAAASAEREIRDRILPELEDPAKTALDSLLTLHGPMILATRDGAQLSETAAGFAMTREQQDTLRAAAQEVVERLKTSPEVITKRAAQSASDATKVIGQGPHPERGSVYGLANIKNISIVLIGGAAMATPALIGALLGLPLVGLVLGAPFSFVVLEAVKKSPAFSALVIQLGARLDAMTEIELRAWLEERARRLAPFRSFVINNEKHLRNIAAATPELRWMLRYIDFIAAQIAPETPDPIPPPRG